MKTINVDVRSSEEFNMDGHAECSVNYPLDRLETYIDSLREYEQIILVCRSGNRASIAKSILAQHGITHVENKGEWQNILCN